MSATKCPVVRITPNEIHVRDPAFWDELMTTNARPRDKTEFLAGLTGRQSVFGTVGHDIHHIRRSALDAFSSKKSIAAFEPSVREKVAELCDAMKRQADNDNVLNLNTAFTALALDVISLYGFGKSYGLLQKPEFAPNWRQMLHNTLESFPLMRHVPWLPAMLKKLPHSIRNLVSKDLALCLELEEQARRDALRAVKNQKQVLLTKEKALSHKRSIFEELVISDLPPEEKTVDRLSEEGFILILAGGDVSASNLAMLSYHLLANPDTLAKLTSELREAIPELDGWPKWQQLENLPYLRACIKEGLRINAVPVARNVRVAPYETLYCNGWTIEPGLDPAIFPIPTKFDPDRWLDPSETYSSDQKARMEKQFFPFGKGGRSCLGINLAYCEMYLALANVLRRFEFELFKTGLEDVEVVSNALVGHPRKESKGVRVKIRKVVGS
ncbi:MAG: hypothetical protein LQ351_004066 [Letrouitia transgressa]|nr:MAG: hypothetical protein LQ351_004066 [Letrouitia transgressa]